MTLIDSVIDLLPRPAVEAGTRLRRRAMNTALESFFYGLAYAMRLHPLSRPSSEVELLQDIPYTLDGEKDHLLDILRPTTFPGPRPVLLYIHGGGFRILSKDTHRGMAQIFASRGFLVFNINYRLAPRHPFPAAVEDACAALAWVVEHAENYGGDLGRLVLAGESAGANLCAGLALACSYRRNEPFARAVWEAGVVPKIVLPACGLFQVSDPERFADGAPAWMMDRLLGVSTAYLGDPLPRPGEREMADPLLVLERGDSPSRPLPPFFMAVGTADPILDDTRRMKEALDRLGVVCEAKYYTGQPHGFHAMVWREAAKQCWHDTFSFIDQHL